MAKTNAEHQAAWRARQVQVVADARVLAEAWEHNRAHVRELEAEVARLQGLVERGQTLHWGIRKVVERERRATPEAYEWLRREVSGHLQQYEGVRAGAIEEQPGDVAEPWTEQDRPEWSRAAKAHHRREGIGGV
jgi:hypothetical protein